MAETCRKIFSSHQAQPGVVLCEAVWDTILCWPPTQAGLTARQHCPAYNGIDPSKFARRYCGWHGRWLSRAAATSHTSTSQTSTSHTSTTLGSVAAPPHTLPDNATTTQVGWTNYSACYTDETRRIMDKLYSGSEQDPYIDEKRLGIARNTRMLELVGLSLSLTTLLISLYIFLRFRSLRNNRTRIHRHLFAAMLVQVVVRLLLYFDQLATRGGVLDVSRVIVSTMTHATTTHATSDATSNATTMDSQPYTSGIDNTAIICEMFYIILEYARTCMFMWMFVEGLYLNSMVTVCVFASKFYRVYYAIGWGVPVLMTAVWAIVTGLHHGHNRCWWNYNLTAQYWILEAPRIAVILLNLIFLANIIVVLVTKIRQNSSSETTQVRKAVKAAVVLLPLLGITNVINLVPAPLDRSVGEFAVWSYITHFLASFQGVFVSLLYCFTNGEVRLAISKCLYDFFSRRTAATYRRSSAFSGAFLTTVAEPSRVEATRRHSLALKSHVKVRRLPPTTSTTSSTTSTTTTTTMANNNEASTRFIDKPLRAIDENSDCSLHASTQL